MNLLNELLSLAETTQPLKTREEISAWLDKMKVKNYDVDEDLFVNVDGNVDLSHQNLTSIQVKFGVVGGNFDYYNNCLTSLTCSPHEVSGDFSCHINKFKKEPDHSFINIAGEFKWRN